MPTELEWFPLYVKNLLTSRKVKKLSNEEFGIYMKLLCYQWIDGPLPLEIEELASICDTNADAMATAWDRVGKCFIKTDDGYLNEFLEDVREEQEMKAKIKSRAGKAGAEARWGKRKDGKRNATALPTQSDTNGNRVEEKRKEEKVIVGDSGEIPYTEDFEEAWRLYPDRPNNPKKAAFRAWKARINQGVDAAELIRATARYAEYCRSENIEPRYIKRASTFFGPDEHWKLDYKTETEEGDLYEAMGGYDV